MYMVYPASIASVSISSIEVGLAATASVMVASAWHILVDDQANLVRGIKFCYMYQKNDNIFPPCLREQPRSWFPSNSDQTNQLLEPSHKSLLCSRTWTIRWTCKPGCILSNCRTHKWFWPWTQLLWSCQASPGSSFVTTCCWRAASACSPCTSGKWALEPPVAHIISPLTHPWILNSSLLSNMFELFWKLLHWLMLENSFRYR